MGNLITAMRRDDFGLDLVFLTGDAGDGKTAACVDLARAEGLAHPLAPIDRAGRFTIIKDASEHREEDLREIVSRSRASHQPLLIAINEGRLRRLGRSAELSDVWEDVIEPALTSWIDEGQAERLDVAMRDRRIGVINFRHRMHVRTVTPAFLKTWTGVEHWEEGPICRVCPKRETCPILANASSLRGEATVRYITDILAFAHFAGQRLPFRRLQGVLAFSLTGALGCSDILSGHPPSLDDRFYSLIFQREVRGHARPEPAARVLAGADPGLAPDPEIDEPIFSWLRGSDSNLPRFEQQFLHTLDGGSGVDVVRALRRFAALHGLSSVQTHWHSALQLLEDFALNDNKEPLLRVVTASLNHLHGHLTTDDEALVGHQIEPAAFRDPARASLELDLGTRFKVGLTRGPVLPRLVSDWLESCPSDVEFVAWRADVERPDKPARLRLDARLLCLLLEVDDGYRFLPALGTYRRELARFHSHMLSFVDPEHVGLVPRAGEHAWRLARGSDRLRFVGQD